MKHFLYLFLIVLPALAICLLPAAASDLKWSADKSLLIVIDDSAVMAISGASGTPQLTFSSPSEEIRFVNYFPESDRLFYSNGNQSLFGAFNSRSLLEAVRIEPEEPILNIAVSPDGSKLLACSGDELSVILYDAEDGKEIKRLSGFMTAAPVYDAVFSPDGSAVLWHSRGTFALQQIEDGTFGETISLWDFAYAYALSPDGKTLAVGLIDENAEQPLVLFFDTQSGAELGRVPVDQQVLDMDFSETGKLLFAADPATLYEIDAEYFDVLARKTLLEGADLSSERRLQRVASGFADLVFALRLNTGGILTTTFQ